VTPQPIIKDQLILGSQVEKEYLKARKGKSDEDRAKVEQTFIDNLARAGFPSIADYHTTISLYGHWWRTLRVIYKDSAQILDGIQEVIRTGENWIGYTFYNHTTIYVPDKDHADDIVDTDYCESHGVEILSDFTDPHGGYIAEPGNFGVMIGIQRPCSGYSIGMTLRKVTQAILHKHYGADVIIDNNELMFTGKKIYGGAAGDVGKIAIGTAALTLNFNATLANRVLKKRPDHPTIKDPHSLNNLLGRVIDPGEMLRHLITEWLEATHSTTMDDTWQTKL